MKLNTVIDHIPINEVVSIYENNTLVFKGTPIDFIGWKKPKHFRSRAVLSMYADKDTLKIHISKEPTFVERSENV